MVCFLIYPKGERDTWFAVSNTSGGGGEGGGSGGGEGQWRGVGFLSSKSYTSFSNASMAPRY